MRQRLRLLRLRLGSGSGRGFRGRWSLRRRCRDLFGATRKYTCESGDSIAMERPESLTFTLLEDQDAAVAQQ